MSRPFASTCSSPIAARSSAGLRPEDFEVRDEGVLQEVDLVRLEQLPLNVILGLDVSQSVNGERLEHLQSAGDSLLRGSEKTIAPRC